MEETSELNKLTLSPPSRGLSLGWRLAFSTALIISLVMGGISIGQLLLDLRKDREIHRQLLKTSLAPLAVRLETAVSLDDMEQNVEEFHAAYVSKGYPVHDVTLLDAARKQVLSTRDAVVSEEDPDQFRAEVPIVSPLLKGEKGALVVQKTIRDYSESVRRNWLLWTAHFAVTVGVVFLFLTATIYFQVTRPIKRLVRGVKKMEMGYWGPVDVGSGAWEIRWLAWRFGSMVQEVRYSVTNLFEAERKARAMTATHTDLPGSPTPQRTLGSDENVSDPTDSSAYRELMAVLNRLEAATPDDPNAARLARGVGQREAIEASQSGFHELKARMEDAALRLLEPDVYTSLDKRLSELKLSWSEWAGQQRQALYRMLEDKAIPCVEVLHRVKHTAGVRAKMHGKDLGLEEVYDLFAFRVIVPTEADCYAALGIIHQAYKPEISRFKDYIAKAKGNGYRSLHTCVKAEDGPVFEVQIRSVAMDRQAERGDAAHWLYKKSGREVAREPAKSGWRDRIRCWAVDATR